MQYDDFKKEKLNRLEKKLYSRNAPDIIDTKKETVFKKEEEQVVENWPEAGKNSFDELASKVSLMAQSKHKFVRKIFIISVSFFILASGVAAFVFLGGGNIVSSKNVDIKVVGPTSVGAGEEVSFDINILNNNNINLESVSLLLEYPEGVRSPSDLSKELDRERFAIESIQSGESFNQNIKAVFFGEKESVKQIKISLEYRVKNSSALFYKEKNYEVSISSAPVIITPTYPKEVNSNQEISFNIEVASNSKDKINDLLVNVSYPFGFVFKDASPKASFGNNVWLIPSLNAGDKKTISIRGNVVGQDNEEKVFRISAGTSSEDDERIIGVPISSLTESILVQKPFIGINFLIENKEGDFAARGGEQVNSDISIRNNLAERIFNVSVLVAFKGGAFSGLSVVPSGNGFFESLNNTILWDKRSNSNLADIEPGGELNFAFRLSPLPYASVPKGATPEIQMIITTKGERILESGSVEEVTAEERRKIVLTTDLSLSSYTLRSLGNIENSGPIPPKVNTPTTYSVLWSISNSFNQVSNVQVRAVLPPYMKWTNFKNPASEIISFDSVTNEVVWNVGSVLSNTGFGSSPKEVYFQLEFLPSSSQIGQAPIILGEATLTGVDKVTGLPVTTKGSSVTTNFSKDPTFKMGDEKVVQ